MMNDGSDFMTAAPRVTAAAVYHRKQELCNTLEKSRCGDWVRFEYKTASPNTEEPQSVPCKCLANDGNDGELQFVKGISIYATFGGGEDTLSLQTSTKYLRLYEGLFFDTGSPRFWPNEVRIQFEILEVKVKVLFYCEAQTGNSWGQGLARMYSQFPIAPTFIGCDA
jgi:hypothetical protein